MRLRTLVSATWRLYAVAADDGTCPLEAFLDERREAGDEDWTKMLQAFRRAAQRGPRHVPGTKPLTGRDGLFEFRRGQLRVLWFYDQDRVVICSHGFVKKSGKAPPRELDRAEASRDRYFAAKQRRELVFED